MGSHFQQAGHLGAAPAGNESVDVSWFVALDGSEFIPVPFTPRERYKPGPPSGVNVNAITHGLNLMTP